MTTHPKHTGAKYSDSYSTGEPEADTQKPAEFEPNASPAQDRAEPGGGPTPPPAPRVVFAALALNETHTGALDAGRPLGFFKTREEAQSAAKAHHGAHKGSVYVHQLTLEPVTP